MKIAPCWSCGSDVKCYSNCECVKCMDPIAYQEWKNNDVEGYNAWLERQEEKYYDY